ncbi:MAG: thiamine pyrophosphate-binding protein [Chloroflexi bacterium]|nr:thiamine pyrophosphate-binding protein [Chloroflexota bacterium]MCI0786771.1 thiamine pyrophosphate-binding protein [Chloroflexota bacterium]
MPQMSGSQALVGSLAREGVEVVFALPGVQIMDAFDAFFHEPSIRLVLVRHEQSAAYMADGYARTTGRPGVALVVPGPGALNATAALGTAYATSSPVLLVCGQIESYNLGKNRGALHEIGEQLDIFKHLTKWCDRATQVEEIPGMVHKAIEHLSTGRPRPVEIEIPWDVLPATADTDLPEVEVFAKQAPEPSQIRDAARLLSQAERPLIWAGGGAREADLSQELLELARALNAPVITTPEGKGAIPEDDPHSLGAFYYGHGPGYLALPQADVILAVGSRLHMSPSVPWSFQPHQKLIQIDADPEEVGRNFPLAVGITADGRLGLQGLLNELGGSIHASRWTNAEMTSIRQQTDSEIKEMAPLQVEIIETIRRELDDDAIMVAGTTDIGYWSHLAYPVLKPRSYLTPSYFATLGYAFPTALGAKVGNPNRQVVATIGDGGFHYAASELSTAVQEGINLVTLVFNNGMLGASYNDQQSRYGGRTIGTELHNPDFAQLAEVYGALGIKLASREELGDALRSALKAQRPVVIEIPMPAPKPPFQIPPHGLEAVTG